MRGNLYVVNFQKDGTIGKVKPDGTVERFITLPEGSIANSIKFDSKGKYVPGRLCGTQCVEGKHEDQKVSVYAHSDKFNQPNDLCINSKNQLFASDPNWKESTGQIWRVDKGGKAVLLEANMGTTNGIELSPDEKTLYVNESVQKKNHGLLTLIRKGTFPTNDSSRNFPTSVSTA